MNALHVIPAIADRYGGPSAAVFGMARALQDAGTRVTIASTDADGEGHLPLPRGEMFQHSGTNVILFRRWVSESAKVSPGLAAWLRVHVADFDVVHVHGLLSHACVTAARAASRARVPFIVRPLGTLHPTSLAVKSARKAMALRLVGERVLRRAAAVHCTTPAEAEAIDRQFAGVQTVVVPLGIDDSAFTDAEEPRARQPLVVCVTRLAPRKGLERLIDAFDDAVANPALAEWRLAVAGDGDRRYVDDLRARIATRGAEHRIALVGWADREAKQSLLSRAALFALPSEHESFGIAVLEAMAAGLPVVVSAEVQLAHWIAPAGAGWIAGGATTDLTSALRAAMLDVAERTARGRAAAALATQFRWPHVAAELLSLYRRVASARRGFMPQAAPAS